MYPRMHARYSITRHPIPAPGSGRTRRTAQAREARIRSNSSAMFFYPGVIITTGTRQGPMRLLPGLLLVAALTAGSAAFKSRPRARNEDLPSSKFTERAAKTVRMILVYIIAYTIVPHFVENKCTRIRNPTTKSTAKLFQADEIIFGSDVSGLMKKSKCPLDIELANTHTCAWKLYQIL